MHTSVAIFVAKALTESEIEGCRILEVGSRNINGSVRPIIESRNPQNYTGVDMVDGKGVDEVVDATNIVEEFGENSFDVVVSTEMLEHAKNWKNTINNIKRVCENEGVIVLTTRSKGFKFHGYPNDYWRYEVGDMKEIFKDHKIELLESDPESPGVFIKASKPCEFSQKDISQQPLYSVVSGKRTVNCPVTYSDTAFEKLQIQLREDGLKFTVATALLNASRKIYNTM
ncbi:methyltransferase domain-containing protein [Halomicrobium mukohataei]|uniref:Methyltransferase domain-containing protein n=1 Tax=Halomicrobium mukohataei TaxID=57705 RepID=A0A847UBB2_9EURY|nr:methyltransferase domain-containing protein [Halomicrobium mukohataei]NLV08378.1 methyltransferase domain-containing protein [Halomicrobium mukohataei]